VAAAPAQFLKPDVAATRPLGKRRSALERARFARKIHIVQERSIEDHFNV
jgi:hypothetical protein